ncbi:MAG: tetratricopeptide repeat protein [Gemmatimonadota bacterium]|nr:tetratricopeptide repeat protein [Gemmatimonadota bacterium]
MSDQFLSSEDYDERAHRLYNEGDYEGALELLKEGLSIYPGAVDLYVGLGYARLAREEFAWARQAFERALVLDPTHEDGLVGMGETLLRFGQREAALRYFRAVEQVGMGQDLDLLLTMGRALYREAMYGEARDFFARACAVRPQNAEAAASLGYALHRLGDEVGAGRQIRRALRIDPDAHEARIYLGHLLYDRGDWEGALREFERVPPHEHWDSLAVWRLVELKRALWHLEPGDVRLAPWERRLEELESFTDPIDQLLAEIENEAQRAESEPDPRQLELFGAERSAREQAVHHVRTPGGQVLRGTWREIVTQMRDQAGFGHETVTQYMRRLAERWHEQLGVDIPFNDPRNFLRAAIDAGIMRLEEP